MRVSWALALALVIAQPAWGALATTWEQDFDDDLKEWKEIEAQLPRVPQGKELVLMDMGPRTTHHFYIDPPSVTVGEDGVVRYTAVIKTSGGALNVTFEGMRCKTRELKIYATGRRDGTWVRAPNTKWQRIERHVKPYHFNLFREYFCTSPGRPTPPKQALDAMRRGVGLDTNVTFD
jgi:hypothetical protein